MTEQEKSIEVYKGVSHPWCCDALGHLTTRYYVGMFDDASYHFLNTVFPDVASRDKIGWADVRHVIEYQNEVGAGDLLEITGSLLRIGGKSITVLYTMHNITRNSGAATLESTSVLFDLDARRAVPLTDSDRRLAETYLTEAE